MAATGTGLKFGETSKGEKGTKTSHGLVTPEGTPEVGSDRVEADKARQEAAAADQKVDEPMEDKVDEPTKDKSGDEDEEDDEENDKTYAPGHETTKEQRETIQKILSADVNKSREVLGIKFKKDYSNAQEHKTAVLNALRDLGKQIHPDFNDDEDADRAFRRIKDAAGKLGLEKKYVKEVDSWDGESDFEEVDFTEKARQDKPSDAIQKIYRQAAPHLEMLFFGTDEVKALHGLDNMNKKIVNQSGIEGVIPADRWTINLEALRTLYGSALPLYRRVLETEDKEAEQELQNLLAELKKSFPDSFHTPMPTPEQKAEVRENLRKNNERKAQEQRFEDQRTTEEAAEKKRQTAAKNKYGNIKFPWVTHPLPNGERIIAGRLRTKDDVSGGGLCCVELPCYDPENPTFEFRDDINPIELQKYFATPGIKLMGETDEEGRPVKVWRARDRPNFKEFLFCVVGKRKTATGAKAKCPETLCCVLMVDGITLLTRSALWALLKKKVAESYIREYCELNGIVPPWDVEPDSWTITNDDKKLLDRLKSDRLNSVPTGNLNPVNRTGGGSDSQVGERLAALERKIENLQTPNSDGGSLVTILKKLEALEVKVAKVDTISTRVDQTSAILNALCVKLNISLD